MNTSKLIAIFLAVFAITSHAADTYIITGSGTTFTATKDGSAFGTANQPIQTVIDAIKSDANGAASTIQFGDLTNTLDIGTAYITFSGGTSGTDWGLITLAGKITSAPSSYATIYLSNGASIASTADITNTVNGATRPAIYNYGTGTAAVWLNKDGKKGIDYANGSTTGFAEVSGVTVNKINPTVTWPTAAAITYGALLSTSVLSDGTSTPTGTFAWTNGSVVPTVTNSGYEVTFTPTDENYNTLTHTVAITVNKADPAILPWPTAAAITYGAALSTSALSGGTSTPAGSFAWKDGSIIPTVTNGGYEVTFTPTDENYNTITVRVNITVNRANYDMLGVSFEDAAVTYNGQPHSILVTGLPAGVTVSSYTGNGQTEKGVHPITATFAVTDPANYNVPAPMTAILTINDKKTYDMSSITFASKTVTYDGNPQSILISGTLPSGVSVSYTYNGQAATGKTEVGKYQVEAVFTTSDPTYNVPSKMVAELEIKAANTDPIRNTQLASRTLKVQTIGNYIVLENLPQNAKVEVYNLQGKRIYSANPENPQILRIGVQTKGMYIVKVK